MPRNPQTHRALTPGPAPTIPPDLDDVDLQLLTILQADGRRPIAALAREVGIAESTCAGRVRALTERGVVQGYHAHLNAARLGMGVQAMVALRMSGHDRATVEALRDQVSQVPGVLAVYNTSGATDFLVHVATPGSDALRAFVLDHLSSRPGVVHAETTLIFEATHGRGLL